ncbi:MAG: hypothetical protein GF334_04835 [Candidatus Altiarchaeales archaeon]|nr:hypothetical protein [Candidatus Altiarchaeales archaeon]
MVLTRQRKIPEDKLKFFYLDRGLTDKEIAEKLGCTQQAVYLARRKFKIDSLSKKERNSKLIKISKRQEEILRGSLLGDAYLSPEGEFDIQHGSKQFGYLLWLFNNLQPYFGEIRNVRTCKRIRSCAHDFGIKLRKEYYSKGKKTITREILDKLSALSLAVWFMDDGQVLPSGNQSRIATCDFTKEENILICEYLKDKWNIEAQVGFNGKYPQIVMNKEATQKLVGLIRLHVPVEMRYKLRPACGISLYLSGGMEFKKDLGSNWRQWLTDQLAPINMETIDPVKIEPPDEEGAPIQHSITDIKIEGKFDQVRSLVRNIFFRKDMFAIQLSDGMVVYYDESVQKGAGTLAEVWESFREGKPVYLVSELPRAKIPSWLIGETTAIFFNFEELINYLKNKDQVLQDIHNAIEIRNKTFEGIYHRG